MKLHVDKTGRIHAAGNVAKAIKDNPDNMLGTDKRGRPHWQSAQQKGGGSRGGDGGGDYTIKERKSRGMLGRGPEKTIYTVLHGGKAVKEFNSREDAEDYRKYIMEYDARERRRAPGEQGPGEIA